MNVQFSLSAKTSSSVSQQGDLSSGTEAQRADLNSGMNQGLSLSQLEKQGTPLSVGQEQLIRTIENAVKSLQGPQTTLDISIHEKTHEIMVKVLNKDTGELIREIPPEKTLDLVAKMMELAGILVDEKI
ncbi:flagellar protein FlaG [Paenibacillus barcinonensis]|uniref:Flagellar protein FlaG n=1 Tax=Paenibacillus barcinonensis TaxID=198119 RepID=A0A2V4VU36_PAEBA|nr:flagellar protein FlaG [Paenibacillus barcinonensis]PYE50642.1 flagellar protein FlaG [Paenibacillus barcinonensis]QKS57334.1 flagellar protein FlaG [Paenibacillus barcinonensis]